MLHLPNIIDMNTCIEMGWLFFERTALTLGPMPKAVQFLKPFASEILIQIRVQAAEWGKIYLSPVVDCFDGRLAAWSIGTRPDKELVNSSLLRTAAQRAGGGPTVIHSDRGGHYCWKEWIGVCEEHGLVRSMSAKGCGPDNSACEGFFGRLKNGFFYYRGWSGVGVDGLVAELEAYLRRYCERRIKRSLGWMSPNECRRKLGYAA